MEKELSKYGKVTRISGETQVENSIAFAKFKDEKQNLDGVHETGTWCIICFKTKHQT